MQSGRANNCRTSCTSRMAQYLELARVEEVVPNILEVFAAPIHEMELARSTRVAEITWNPHNRRIEIRPRKRNR